ncbi:uncharacterized protein EV420DRAFT_1568217 [Desarmillaria tabescens]|uniref:Uncharacterized protein n=1 Tax=Armillaria tabescens TaxID=1929756 RepID=A0AA39JU18_ARMTA|nr:uncharacterized protein EV420DRAFT_1568217 [Desarmillaria tabescens]KAK0447915.1 hypothetical protein EV420DRAFT_1568217 [Desarmillaria tabescens]
MALSLNADEATDAVLSLLGLPDAGTWATTTNSITYTNWAHLPEWIEKVLDVSWCVIYGRVSVGEGSAHSLWYLKHNGLSADPSVQLTVSVHVETRANGDGMLDMAASKQAVRRRLAEVIDSTDFLIERVWTRGDLSEFGEYSVQFAGGGGWVVAAGQTVIEIYDDNYMLTSETFERYARKLLEHTIRRDSPPLTILNIKRGPMLSLTRTDDNHNLRPRRIKVCSVDPKFYLWFELDKPVIAARATVKGSAPAISSGTWVVEKGVSVRTVKLEFTIARLGHHVEEVHAYFAESETMVSRSQTFEIEVVHTQQTP